MEMLVLLDGCRETERRGVVLIDVWNDVSDFLPLPLPLPLLLSLHLFIVEENCSGGWDDMLGIASGWKKFRISEIVVLQSITGGRRPRELSSIVNCDCC